MFQRFGYNRWSPFMEHEHNKAHVESLMYLLKFIFHDSMEISQCVYRKMYEVANDSIESYNGEYILYWTLFTIIDKLLEHCWLATMAFLLVLARINHKWENVVYGGYLYVRVCVLCLVPFVTSSKVSYFLWINAKWSMSLY